MDYWLFIINNSLDWSSYMVFDLIFLINLCLFLSLFLLKSSLRSPSHVFSNTFVSSINYNLAYCNSKAHNYSSSYKNPDTCEIEAVIVFFDFVAFYFSDDETKIFWTTLISCYFKIIFACWTATIKLSTMSTCSLLFWEPHCCAKSMWANTYWWWSVSSHLFHIEKIVWQIWWAIKNGWSCLLSLWRFWWWSCCRWLSSWILFENTSWASKSRWNKDLIWS